MEYVGLRDVLISKKENYLASTVIVILPIKKHVTGSAGSTHENNKICKAVPYLK